MSCYITIVNANARYQWKLQGMDIDDVMVSVPACLADIVALGLRDKDVYTVRVQWAAEHGLADTFKESVRGSEVWGVVESVLGGSPERDARELLASMLRWEGLVECLASHPAKERSKRFFKSVCGLVCADLRGPVTVNVERFTGFPHLSEARQIALLRKVARAMVAEGCHGRDILGGLL
jgi:hypothetical protein